MVSLLRKEEYLRKRGRKLSAFLIKYLRAKISRKYSVFLPLNVIEPGFLMFHPHNIMINATRIGRNFSVQFNVSLVAGGHDGSSPDIGDNVTIGTGSTLVGGCP